MLPEIDYDALDIEELKAIKRKIDLAIETYRRRRLVKARHELDQIAKQYGVTLEEVMEATTSPRKGPLPPKFRNPEIPQETWTGRGRNPKWLVEALATGKTIEDFRIPDAAGDD